ncbi:hypothetical protein [Klebsiella aerogenes]
MTTIYELIKDPYERKARLIPGLLVALPLIIPLVAVYGAKNPILTCVVGLLSSCGAVFALANISRGMGKSLEAKLVSRWGGMPTTIALRHRDTFFDFVTKKRIHKKITQKTGIEMPSEEEESLNPSRADEIYIGATRLLREMTRDNREMLFQENVVYGFHRNMTAMRWVGLVSSFLGFIYGLVIAKVLILMPPHVNIINISNPSLPASLTLFISLLLLLAWLFYFNESSLKRMGFSYAERLFECLNNIIPLS